jgi:hypothetical protein
MKENGVMIRGIGISLTLKKCHAPLVVLCMPRPFSCSEKG